MKRAASPFCLSVGGIRLRRERDFSHLHAGIGFLEDQDDFVSRPIVIFVVGLFVSSCLKLL